MKLVGIADPDNRFSYQLLAFIKERFGLAFDLTIPDLSGFSLFSPDQSLEVRSMLSEVRTQILAADGIIIGASEHKGTISPSLKTLLEWLSHQHHPFWHKPVMIAQISNAFQPSLRLSEDLRQILTGPDFSAWPLPEKAFFLGTVKQAFNKNGQLENAELVESLALCLQHFIRYIALANDLKSSQMSLVDDMTADATSGASESFVDDPIALARLAREKRVSQEAVGEDF